MRNKIGIYALLVLIALLLAALLCHYKGDHWEQKIRKTLYSIKRDSIPAYATTITDNNGIPYVQYAKENGITAGTQYNATIIANYAISYYTEYKKTADTALLVKFKNCIRWLSGHMTRREGYALYIFNWQQPWYPAVKAPFTGGMTSGRSIEAFTDAFILWGDSSYLLDANLLLNGFYIPIQKGGFTYMEKEGWWYEEVADSHANTPHILDGHIFAIQGVQKFWDLTKNDSAKIIIDQGLAALKYQLPMYDGGHDILHYDIYKKPADQHYREVITNQLLQLWQNTGDTLFYQYHTKWIAPLKKPYLIRIFRDKNRSGLLLYFLISTLLSFILITGYQLIAKISK